MSANFTPALDGYTGQQPFRYWCQMVLPLVYDDSLSYYELLNKVVVYLNNVITDVSTVEGNVDALLNAYQQLQNYVNNYFENLNVQGEINNKLDEMATDGTLSQLISPYVSDLIGGVVAKQIGGTVANQIGGTVAKQIDGVVAEQINIPTSKATTAWLQAHVNPVGSAVIVDDSLTISGAAADAKTVGDKAMLDRGNFTGTDLKTAREFGYYKIISDVSSNITDLPIQSYAGRLLTLEVHSGFSNGIVQKIYTTDNMANAYYRYSQNANSATDWKNYVVLTDSTLTQDNVAANAKTVGDKSMLDRGNFTGTDLKTARKFGYYHIKSEVSTNITDLPVQSYAGKVLTLEVHTSFSGGIMQKIYSYGDMTHAYYRYTASESSADEWEKYVVLIDSTLTQNNAAANAKTVGDKAMLDRGNFTGTDLKTAREFGYYKIMPSDSGNITDLPVQSYSGRALTLEVHSGFSNGIVQKIYTTDNMTNAYYRYSQNVNLATDWKNYVVLTDNTLTKNNVAANAKTVGDKAMLDRGNFTGTDLKTAREFGYYHIKSEVSTNITDLPVQYYAGKVLTLEVHTSFSGGIMQKIYSYDDMTHAYYRYTSSESSANEWMNYKPESLVYSPLTKYKWCAIGDSFTHGDFKGATNPIIETGKYAGQLAVYPYLIGNRTNMTVANIAVNGLRIGGNNGFVATKLSNIPDDSDYITIALGINDLPDHQDTPLGTINDATYDTFYGAWNVLMEYLFANFGDKHIGIIATNGVPYQYKVYSDAIIEIAEKWCVPYLNMAYGIQVPTMNRSGKSQSEHPSLIFTARNNAFNVGSGNSHPNAKAHEYMSVFIENWLQTI